MIVLRFKILLLLLLPGLFVIAQTEKDSLLTLLEKTQDSEEKAVLNTKLADYFLYENRDSARYHYFKSIALYDKDKNQSYIGSIYKNIGMSYIFDNKLDSGIFYMEKSLKNYLLLHDTLNSAFIYNNLGLLNINIDNNQKGVEYLILALKYKEKLVNQYSLKKLNIGSTQLNVGIAFQNLYNLDKAIEYYQKAMENCKLQDDKMGVSRAKMQLANGYSEQKDLKKAERLYRELIKDSLFISDLSIKAKLYNNFGALLSDKKEYEEAMQILNKAYQLNIEDDNLRSALKNLNNISLIYFELDKKDSLIHIAKKALSLAEQCKSPFLKIIPVELLSKVYYQMGDKNKSIEYYQELIELKDTVYSIEKNRVIAEMETKYDTEKKQKQIEVLNSQQLIQDLEIRQKTILNRWISAGFAFLTIILIILIITLKKVKKQKGLLDKQNEQLADLNNGLQKMFAIVSHDIRNFINGFKSAGTLLAYYLKEGNGEKLEALSEKLTINSKRLDELLDNILNWAAVQSDLYKPDRKELNLYEIVHSQISFIEDLAKVKEVEIINNIPLEQNIIFDINNLNFIIRNLLSNAIKYTEKGKIIFSFENTQDKEVLVIEDTGVGIEADELETIFTNRKSSSKKGTAGEKGSGLGLKLVYDFVKLNNAEIKVESTMGKGACFKIIL